MHYILKLPGTIATVVNYPTSSPAYADVNAASLAVVKINNQGEGWNPITSVVYA